MSGVVHTLGRALRATAQRLRDRLIRGPLHRQAGMEARLAIAQARIANAEARLEELRHGLGRTDDTCGNTQTELATLRHSLEVFGHDLGRTADACGITQKELATLRHSLSRALQVLGMQGRSLTWMVEHGQQACASLPATQPGSGPLVSVIMPVWNDACHVERAIASVLAQSHGNWELIIVDDGSSDETPLILRSCAGDHRILLLRQDHAGAAAARNRALAHSRGDIIAYLDSDNTWYPQHLAVIVRTMQNTSQRTAVHTGQLFRDHETGAGWIQASKFDHRDFLECRMHVDLNVYAHRRSLYELHGGFDTQLSRLMDWDLILRYSAESPPLLIPAVTACYEMRSAGTITRRENESRNRWLVKHKLEQPVREPLRVLYVLWHYPQLSESYVETEIRYMRRRGVDVAVWSEVMPASPYPVTLPVYRGSLAAAIADFRPQVAHTHWLPKPEHYARDVAAAGLPFTVRAHGFEFSTELATRMDAHPVVRAMYVFPFLAKACPPNLTKLRHTACCFDPLRYYPPDWKDPWLVVRVGACLPTKDLGFFMRVAKLCPRHRFVLALVRCNHHEPYVEEMIALNRSLGEPVDLRVNVPPDEIAALVRAAGVYLHTNGPDSTYGMPISIAEAMAGGAYVLGRRCPGASAYIGDAGEFYETEEEAAALVNATLRWSEDDFHSAQVRAIDRAYAQYVDAVVLAPILEDWRHLAAETRSQAPRQAA